MAKSADKAPYPLKGQYVYGHGPYEAWLELDGVKVPVSYNTGVRMSDGGVSHITPTAEEIMSDLQPFAERYRQAYGGDWVFHVENREQEPPFVRGSRQLAEEVILSGPDTPGRRFLAALRAGESLLAPMGVRYVKDLPGMEPWFTGD